MLENWFIQNSQSQPSFYFEMLQRLIYKLTCSFLLEIQIIFEKVKYNFIVGTIAVNCCDAN